MPVQSKITSYEIGRRLGNKGPRTRVKPPAQCEKSAKGNLIIFQGNIEGLQNKTVELAHHHMALLQ